MTKIQVHFYHPGKQMSLTQVLSRDTRFSDLTDLLYQAGFLEPQKPGYRYLYQEHLCGLNHTLGDYLPENTSEMSLEIFQFPVVLI